MTKSTLMLVLALAFVVLLILAITMWALWVRPHAQRTGGRTGRRSSMASVVTDFATSLTYSRGRLPWTLRVFGVVLALMLSDLVLLILLTVFGVG